MAGDCIRGGEMVCERTVHKPSPRVASRESDNNPSVRGQRNSVATSGVVVLQVSGIFGDIECYVGLRCACCVA